MSIFDSLPTPDELRAMNPDEREAALAAWEADITVEREARKGLWKVFVCSLLNPFGGGHFTWCPLHR